MSLKSFSSRSAFYLILFFLVVAGIFFYKQYISQNGVPDKNAIYVGVSQATSNAVFDSFKSGIIKGFTDKGYVVGKTVVFDFQNAQGDTSAIQAIAQKFAASNYNIFIPMGTSSAQALANLVKDRPIIFCGVSNPLKAGLVATMEKPGKNVTGARDIILYNRDLELLKQIAPNSKKVGILYNPGEVNSASKLVDITSIAKGLGLTVVFTPITNTSEVLAGAQAIVNKVDSFYIINDNTVVAGQNPLIKVALDNKKPLIAIDSTGVQAGGLATVSVDYEKVCENAADIAIRVLKGENPGTIPVKDVSDPQIFLNKTTAEKIGIELPLDLLGKATKIYQ